MAATLGGMPLPFARCKVNGISVALKEIEFPGIDGVGGLDMGKRKRRISITGFLPDATGGTPTGKDIEDLDQGTVMTLSTGIGSRSFLYCRVVDSWTDNWVKTGGTGGEKQSCDYGIELEQLRSATIV